VTATISPRITIITSIYNPAGHLPHTLYSIGEQTFREFQWIVLDGNSTEGGGHPSLDARMSIPAPTYEIPCPFLSAIAQNNTLATIRVFHSMWIEVAYSNFNDFHHKYPMRVPGMQAKYSSCL